MFEGSNLLFGAFDGFGFEGAEGVIVKGKRVTVSSSFCFDAFIADIGGKIFRSLSVNLDFGGLEGLDENWGDRGSDNFLCDELFRCVSERGKGAGSPRLEARVGVSGIV